MEISNKLEKMVQLKNIYIICHNNFVSVTLAMLQIYIFSKTYVCVHMYYQGDKAQVLKTLGVDKAHWNNFLHRKKKDILRYF